MITTYQRTFIYVSLFMLASFACERQKESSEDKDFTEVEYKKQINELQDSLIRLKSVTRSSQDSLIHLISQHDSANHIKPQIRYIHDTIKVEDSSLRKQIHTLADSLKQHEAHYLKVMDSLHVFITNQEKRSANDVRKATSEYQQKINNLKAELSAQHQRNLALDAEISQLQKKLTELSNETRAVKDSITYVRKSTPHQAVATQDNPNIELERDLTQLKKEKTDLNETIARLQKQLQDQHKLVANLKDSLTVATQPLRAALPPGSTALSEAIRILLIAKRKSTTDPTLALQLMQEATRLSQDSTVIAEARALYLENNFYQEMFSFNIPVKAFDHGKNEWVVLLQDGTTHYYKSREAPAKSFSNITSIDFSEGRHALLLGNTQGQIGVYNTQLDNIQKTLKAHNLPVTALAFPAELNTYIISGSKDKTLQVYDKQYNRTTRLVGLKAGVSSLAVDPKSQLIAAASGDPEPRIWNFDGKLLLKLPAHPDSVFHIALSEKADRIITASAANARLWDIEGKLIAILKGHQHKISAVRFARSGLIATGDNKGDLLLWDKRGKLISTFLGHTDSITGIKFSDDDHYLYSSSSDGTIKKWLLKKPQELDFTIVDPLSAKDKRTYQITY